MSKKNSKRSERDFDKAKIKKDNGLNVSYDKDELSTMVPHLMKELSNKKNSLKIEAVEYEVEEELENQNTETEKCVMEDLSNPKTIDFLRRCSTKEEALEILNYLLKRNELSEENYKIFKKKINKSSGLEKLIRESGGFKRPGYYMRKYYYSKTQKNDKVKD
jgi:hypothetical protein